MWGVGLPRWCCWVRNWGGRERTLGASDAAALPLHALPGSTTNLQKGLCEQAGESNECSKRGAAGESTPFPPCDPNTLRASSRTPTYVDSHTCTCFLAIFRSNYLNPQTGKFGKAQVRPVSSLPLHISLSCHPLSPMERF